MLALSSTYENESGKNISFNELKNHVIILKDIDAKTLVEIGTEVKQYYRQKYLKKIRSIDQRKDAINKKNHTILAFSYNHHSDGTSITFTRTSLPKMKEHFGYSPINPNSNFTGDQYISARKFHEKHLQKLDIRQQQALFDELLKAGGEQIFTYANKTEAFYSLLVDALIELMKAKGVEYIYNTVIRLNSERQYFYKEFMKLMPQLEKGTSGTIVQLRQTLTIIGMHLHKQEAILLPLLWVKDQWMDANLFEVASQIMSPKVKKTLLAYGKSDFEKMGSIHSVIGLFLCSTIESHKDYTPMLKYIVYNTAKQIKSRAYAIKIKNHLRKLQLFAETNKDTKEWIDYDPNLLVSKVTVAKTLTLSSIYENELGKTITINEYTDRVIPLKNVDVKTLDKIAIEVKLYLMKKHLESLHVVSSRTLAKKVECNQTILAFGTHFTNGKHVAFNKISIELLKEYFGYNPINPNYSDDNTISIHDFYMKYIKPLNIEEQQTLYRKLLNKYKNKIARFTERKESFSFDIVDSIIEVIKIKGPEYVYNGAIRLSKENYFYKKFLQRILRMDGIVAGTTSQLNRSLSLVGMQLRKHDVFLLPFLWIKSTWNYPELEEASAKLMSKNTKVTLNNYKYLVSEMNEVSLSNEIDTVVGLYLCSTIKSQKDFTPMLKYIILSHVESTNRSSFITQVKTHLYRLQNYAIASGDMNKWVEYKPAKTSTDIIYLKTEAEEYPHLIEWIRLANIYLSNDIAKRRKTVNQYEKAIKQWILFLGSLNKPPLEPNDVSRREHIRNVLEIGSKKHFFDIVSNYTISAKSKNLYLRRVQFFFNYIKESLFYNVQTLIIDNDKFYMGSQRNKTTRKRIPASLLAIAKNLLFHDLSHIETFKSAENAMYNQQAKETKIVWWPGFMNLMKILLYLPIRNKQGRWLDSGELDEFILDYENMEYVKNPSPHAIKGRKSCVIQIEIDPITSEKHYTIYISTNKTGEPYTIPYAPYEVIEAIRDQQRFNHEWTKPLTKPVKAVDKASKEPEKTSELYPDICPLFRLPIGKITDDQAISGDRLMTFFIHLLEGVQAIANNEGKNITLVTYIKPGSSRKQALFDIHALRVTGISELIEAGVPVDIVAEFVAGHANQVMTLYYNVQRYGRVREQLEKAQEHIKAKESIINLMEDLDEFEEFILVNETDGDKQLAFDFLSAEDGLTDIALDGMCPGVSCSSVGRDDKCCPKCSVWMTGPSFLVGQTMKINTLIYKIRKSAKELASYRKEKITTPNILRKQHLDTQIESETQNLEHMLSEWGLRYRFIQRSIIIADDFENFVNSKNTDNKMALISTDSTLPVIKLEESDELGILNHICQAGAIFEEMSVQEAQYDLEYLLNQLLQKNGIYPFLVLLDKETAKKTSLMLVDGLLSKYNSSELLNMVNGNKSLSTEDIKYITSHIKRSDNTIIKNTFFLEEHHE